MSLPSDYGLIDFGGGARLERFAGRLVDRPHAGAGGARAEPAAWARTDLRFDRGRGWSGPGLATGPWPFEHAGLRLELRATDTGQVGLFPEQFGLLDWIRARIEDRAAAGRQATVLHLFGYTGLATLAMAGAGAQLTHVDASKPTVTWARRNADLSGLSDRPIRWIVDDALAFSEREARRGRTYAGIVLDPPSYGHGSAARSWRLDDDLPRLLAVCARLIEPDGFALLTAHTPGFDDRRLEHLLRTSVGATHVHVERGELGVTALDGRVLELGAFARSTGAA